MDVTSLPHGAQPSNRWALPGECQCFGWAARCQCSCSGACLHPVPREPHPTATPTSVLPTPLEPQQRLRMPKTCRHSLSLGTHLSRQPHSSWYRRAVPTLAELWTPGQMDSPSPWASLCMAVFRLWGHGLVLGCQRGAMGAGRGDCVPKSRMGGKRYEEDPGLSTLSHLPCILHCVLCTEHPVATSAHPALH